MRARSIPTVSLRNQKRMNSVCVARKFSKGELAALPEGPEERGSLTGTIEDLEFLLGLGTDSWRAHRKDVRSRQGGQRTTVAFSFTCPPSTLTRYSTCSQDFVDLSSWVFVRINCSKLLYEGASLFSPAASRAASSF